MSIKLLFTPLCLWAMGYLGIYIRTARIWSLRSLIEGLPSVSTGLGDQRSPIFLIIFLWATTIPTGRPFPRMERPGARRWRAGCLVRGWKCRLWSSQKGAFPDVSCKISHIFCGIWNQFPESDGFPEWFDQCQTWWEAHPLTFAIFFSR